MHNETQFTIWISHRNPRAMVPMGNSYLDQPRRSEGDGTHGNSLSGLQPQRSEGDGTDRNPLQCRLWFGSNGETHVKSLKGNLTMILPRKSKSQHTSTKSGHTGRNAGIHCNYKYLISNPRKENSATERKPLRK